MEIKFGKKFTEKHLGSVVNEVYLAVKSGFNDKIVFDLSKIEYIGNEELLVLWAIFKSLAKAKRKFRVKFVVEGTDTHSMNDRFKRQLIEMWDIWKIWETVPAEESNEYLGLSENLISSLRRETGYDPANSMRGKIFDRLNVTPFVDFDYIEKFSEAGIRKKIEPIYRLTAATDEILRNNKCHHPFTSKALSGIITEELYLNFLDHSGTSELSEFPRLAFMNISFRDAMKDRSPKKIQSILRKNFDEERLPEVRQFFFDEGTGSFHNTPYIEYSFLDFGAGIANTLREFYSREIELDPIDLRPESDSNIIRYAFDHYTSRHPILDPQNRVNREIPRGLFDVIGVVQRYNGLLVVRSGFGKVIFNFRETQDVDQACCFFGKHSEYFPGTLISFTIPALEDETQLDLSAIKPSIVLNQIASQTRKYVCLQSIVDNTAGGKDQQCQSLIVQLRNTFCDRSEASLTFLSFLGSNIERSLAKKLLYFLLSDYDVNLQNNVVILDLEDSSLLDDIGAEILRLPAAVQTFKLHPLPVVTFARAEDSISVRWLGVTDPDDVSRLNELLFEQHSLTRSDFNDPHAAIGQLNTFDSLGNFVSNFPNREQLRVDRARAIDTVVSYLLEKHQSITRDDGQSVYLCSGNYYQREYVDLSNLLNKNPDCRLISLLLWDRLRDAVTDLDDCRFICLSGLSEKILRALIAENLVAEDRCLFTESYFGIDRELTEENVCPDAKYVLICHVLSSGFITEALDAQLRRLGASLGEIGVLISILDRKWAVTEGFLDGFEKRIVALFEHPISKFTKEQIGSVSPEGLIRINPHTHIPIKLRISRTFFEESVIFRSHAGKWNDFTDEIELQNDFLQLLPDEAILIGFLKQNNLIHPYYFDTKLVIESLSEKKLREIFDQVDRNSFQNEKLLVFCPRNSDIRRLDDSKLANILGNHQIEVIEIERFLTDQGWRFPHNADYLEGRIQEMPTCLILDDGSCTGDTLLQMVNEISFYDIKQIYMLCFVGRVPDHKREFLSRLKRMKKSEGKQVPVTVRFASHWHLPSYQLDENPNVREIRWLNSVIELQNTPVRIKRIAQSVLKEIEPRGRRQFIDHKYLPKDRKTGRIPKREMLLVREEIGKVTGYRLYRESYKYFNFFAQKYQRDFKEIRSFKELELVCAVLTVEPYLFERIREVLPDVVEIIERFVRHLIVSDSAAMDSQTYSWSKKDILHLYFIAFRGSRLIAEITPEMFRRLVEFGREAQSTINYVFYKLLEYFPINPSEFSSKRFDKELRELVDAIKDDRSLPHHEIATYRQFVASLPSRQDFYSQRLRLFENYSHQKADEYHLESKSFGHNVSLINNLLDHCIAKLRNSNNISQSEIDRIRRCWISILEFVNPILAFSKRFPEYLTPFSYRSLFESIESGSDSVREMVGFNQSVVFRLNEAFKDDKSLEKVNENIIRMQLIVGIDSNFYNLIETPKANLYEFLTNFLAKAKEYEIEVDPVGLRHCNADCVVSVPKLYMDKLIKDELVNNLRSHAILDDGDPIKLTVSALPDGTKKISLTNKVRTRSEPGRSLFEGTKCLSLLSESVLFPFRYQYRNVDGRFSQDLFFEEDEKWTQMN